MAYIKTHTIIISLVCTITLSLFAADKQLLRNRHAHDSQELVSLLQDQEIPAATGEIKQDVSSNNFKNQQLLTWYAGRGEIEKLRGIIASIDINGLDKDGYTAIYKAAQGCGDIQITKFLLEHKANPNIPYAEHGRLALMAAASGSNPEIVQALLDAKAEVNAYDRAGNTALHLTNHTHQGHRVMELLLQAGAQVNAQNHQEHTPLYSVTNLAEAEILVNAGAIITKKILDEQYYHQHSQGEVYNFLNHLYQEAKVPAQTAPKSSQKSALKSIALLAGSFLAYSVYARHQDPSCQKKFPSDIKDLTLSWPENPAECVIS